MDRRLLASGFIWSMLLAACSAPSPGTALERPEPSVPEVAPLTQEPIVPALTLVRQRIVPAQTLEVYKKEFAQRVAHASPDVFDDPLPKVLKSIVVVEVTINRDGKLAAVSIRRSNGYKDLENVALNSVRRAAPFAAPSAAMRRSDGSVNFLETFLFRGDGRFQIRSLAGVQ